MGHSCLSVNYVYGPSCKAEHMIATTSIQIMLVIFRFLVPSIDYTDFTTHHATICPTIIQTSADDSRLDHKWLS
jgi:hypothetical protein